MIISVKDISFSYTKNMPVLEDISFEVEKGDVLSVIGPNGAGKTTLFKCLLGQLEPSKGTIEIDGTMIGDIPRRELAGKIAYIPQLRAGTFDYTVMDTILMGTASSLSPLSLPGKSQYEAAQNAVETIGITKLIYRKMSHLSEGEKQLVYIARALAQRAEILIMDEPTSALDYGNQIKVMNTVTSLAKQGYTILISMHNPKAAIKYSTKTVAIMNNKIRAFGMSKEVITEDFINELYNIETD